MFAWFENLIQPFPKTNLTQPPQGVFAFCAHYSKGVWPVLFCISVLSACIAMLEVALFGYLGQMVDWFSTRDPETFLAEESSSLLWMSLALLLILPGMVIIKSCLTHQSLLGNYPMRIRWLAHQYVLRQSLSYFQDEFAGRVATKVMQTALAVRETVMKLLDLMVYICVYFLSILVLVFNTDPLLALPFVVWLIVYILILRILLPRLKRVSKKQADARSIMTGRIVDSYTNIMTVKLFSHSAREEAYAKEGMNGFLETVHPQMRLATILYSCVWIANVILVFTVTALAVNSWTMGIMSGGALAVAVSLALRLNGISQWIMWEVSSIFENIGTVQDGINSLAVPIAIQDQAEPKKLNLAGGAIDIEQVNFAYPVQNNPPIQVFNDLSLHIKPGEKVGLVGRSGSGKSTLVNLLLRFYDIQSGSIKIDGQSIQSLAQEDLRAQISMVTQDTSLMHRSVRDNIIYGKEDATEEELLTAARQAEALEFIERLSDASGRVGFAAHVGERGVKLSGGQRQRIAIARVMLKDAPILILDEATSALDSEVEAAIQEGLEKIMVDKTVLAIAHRLSTIAKMDRLIVLDEGKIVESGSHAELLALNGIYAKLWEHQTGGFLGLE
ncbi:ABC transporter ATP-binding protein [Opacimonas viscosa]|uniref:ABC transporter ATP-binding protein/permease n=1 Tax=Opacimonas viscosa TaxID=2961944 RepID=A0AA42BL15_9ALTE|nr:ABC transporter ATP-binding protein [Opacimonas viscosa]MCP3428139.1 ABC transporter ATP-binding protein/permease [Opacimonas viscosa]